jgi:hypothetical protein
LEKGERTFHSHCWPRSTCWERRNEEAAESICSLPDRYFYQEVQGRPVYPLTGDSMSNRHLCRASSPTTGAARRTMSFFRGGRRQAESDSSLTRHRVIHVGKGTGFGFPESDHELVDTPTSFSAIHPCAPPYSHTSPDTQGKPFFIQLRRWLSRHQQLQQQPPHDPVSLPGFGRGPS